MSRLNEKREQRSIFERIQKEMFTSNDDDRRGCTSGGVSSSRSSSSEKSFRRI